MATKRAMKPTSVDKGPKKVKDKTVSGNYDYMSNLKQQWIDAGYKGDMDLALFSMAITVVGQLIEREASRSFKDNFDLSPSEVRIIMVLRRAAPGERLRPTDLFKRLLVTSGAMTKQINRLESHGLISRSKIPGTDRGFYVKLTAKGRKTVDKCIDTANVLPMARDVFYSLPTSDRKSLLSLLRQLVKEVQTRTHAEPLD